MTRIHAPRGAYIVSAFPTPASYRSPVVTVFGVVAVTFMVTMYALEARHRYFTLAFGCGCLLASAYGFLSGAWPFGAVEIVWAVIAVRRWWIRPSTGTMSG